MVELKVEQNEPKVVCKAHAGLCQSNPDFVRIFGLFNHVGGSMWLAQVCKCLYQFIQEQLGHGKHFDQQCFRLHTVMFAFSKNTCFIVRHDQYEHF